MIVYYTKSVQYSFYVVICNFNWRFWESKLCVFEVFCVWSHTVWIIYYLIYKVYMLFKMKKKRVLRNLFPFFLLFFFYFEYSLVIVSTKYTVHKKTICKAPLYYNLFCFFWFKIDGFDCFVNICSLFVFHLNQKWLSYVYTTEVFNRSFIQVF